MPRNKFPIGNKLAPKPFVKGQSGNPKGRTPKLPEIDALMAEILGDDKDGITAAKAILMKLRQKATGGDLKAAEMLLDRGYGRPKQSADLNLGGQKDNPILSVSAETIKAISDKLEADV